MCIYCTTRYIKCGRIGTKMLFFFTFIEECWYGKFGRGSKSAKGVPYPLWHRVSLIPLFKSQFWIIFSILFRACSHNIVEKNNARSFFKLTDLKSNFTLILSYLNPALNNPAQEFKIFQWIVDANYDSK